MSTLDDLKRAHTRVQELRARRVSAAEQEFKAAMNRLMSLIRHASPDDVAAFDEWRRKQANDLTEASS